MSETVTLSKPAVEELFAHLTEIVKTLENAGMVDTAKAVRLEAQQLTVDQHQWEG